MQRLLIFYLYSYLTEIYLYIISMNTRRKEMMQMNELKKGLIYKAVTGIVVLVAKLINFAEKYKDD